MNKIDREFSDALMTAPMTGAEIDAVQAVEGLELSPRMRALFEQAEREGWSSERRHQAILDAFGVSLD